MYTDDSLPWHTTSGFFFSINWTVFFPSIQSPPFVKDKERPLCSCIDSIQEIPTAYLSSIRVPSIIILMENFPHFQNNKILLSLFTLNNQWSYSKISIPFNIIHTVPKKACILVENILYEKQHLYLKRTFSSIPDLNSHNDIFTIIFLKPMCCL